MSAGTMPALDLPGLMMPGQFGPMMRVLPDRWAAVKNSAVSLTGTPSVMHTTNGISASMDSMTALLVNLAGTKITDTLAPVAAMASLTVPNTGTLTPSRNSTFWPALRGLVPPTICDPESIMRWVCFMPSEPVMP